MTIDERFMRRCIELAIHGIGQVAPNPMVGAVLVDKDGVIVGEGLHQKYGEAHAEVNAIRQSLAKHADISKCTLYVSLEPCSHHGKTPPCTDLIINYGIPRVVIGCRDPFDEVNGRGIAILKSAGISVVEDVLVNECREINKRFFTFHLRKRPYILLKWAQTSDGFMAANTCDAKTKERLLISNEYSNRLVHKWRSEEAAIMVGTRTILEDDPLLTTRLWPGRSPVRVAIDIDGRIPVNAAILNDDAPSIIFTFQEVGILKNIKYFTIKKDRPSIPQILEALYSMNIQSIMVEGGPRLLDSFIREGCWDEARIITAPQRLNHGLAAPQLGIALFDKQEKIHDDHVDYYRNPATVINDENPLL